MFNDHLLARVALDIAAPNKFTIAFDLDQPFQRSVATTAAHVAASVQAVAGRVAYPLSGAQGAHSVKYKIISL